MKTHVFLFMNRFESALLAGTKVTTFRAPRKRLPQVGDLMDQRVWTGAPYRSPQRKLQTVEVIEVAEVQIKFNCKPGWIIGDIRWHSADTLARQDGFSNWREMCAFFVERNGTEDFQGHMYRWKPVSNP